VLISTNLAEDALDYQRFETKGFVVFLEPGIRPPRELHLHMVAGSAGVSGPSGTATRSCP
jgi:hypothetical protein